MSEITESHFTSEAEALAEIEAMGWHALARDVVISKDEELHWHDFESVVFIVSGTLRAADEDGLVTEVGSGSRVRVSPGTVHREIGGSSYRAIFGFNIKLSEFSRPVNKPVSMLRPPHERGAA